MARSANARWAVAVFAHNEEACIAAALDSLFAGADGHRLDAFVLINGCTDRTETIIEGYADRSSAIHPVVIALGDKSNAWNIYVHEVAPEAEVHFFVDGDVRIRPASFCCLQQALRDHPRAYAASGIPMSGRSRATWAAGIQERHSLPGPLYALRENTLAALRAQGLRLPIGLIGDDALLGWLLKRNFDPKFPENRNFVTIDVRAGFEFDSLSPLRLRDWRLYHRRLHRNSLRQMQFNLLIPLLRERGLAALPARIADIYTTERLARLKPRWSHFTGYFDLLALRQMRLDMARREGRTT